MIDLFLNSILTAWVKREAVATIKLGAEPIPFGAVIIITMVAAMGIDPQLFWDKLKEGR